MKVRPPFEVGQWVRALEPYAVPLEPNFPDKGAVGRIVEVRREGHEWWMYVDFVMHPDTEHWLMYENEIEVISEPV